MTPEPTIEEIRDALNNWVAADNQKQSELAWTAKFSWRRKERHGVYRDKDKDHVRQLLHEYLYQGRPIVVGKYVFDMLGEDILYRGANVESLKYLLGGNT